MTYLADIYPNIRLFIIVIAYLATFLTVVSMAIVVRLAVKYIEHPENSVRHNEISDSGKFMTGMAIICFVSGVISIILLLVLPSPEFVRGISSCPPTPSSSISAPPPHVQP